MSPKCCQTIVLGVVSGLLGVLAMAAEKWSSQDLFGEKPGCWSVATVASTDWSGASRMAEKEKGNWFRGSDRGNLDRVAWRAEYLSGRHELCLFPGDAYDAVLCWTAPGSGVYDIEAVVWAAEKGDGIEFAVQSTAMEGAALALLSKTVHNGQRSFSVSEVAMVEGQALRFRVGKGGTRAFDHLNQMKITVTLRQSLPDQEAAVLARRPKRSIALGDDQTRISLSPKGVLESITDLVTGTPLLRAGANGPAWRLRCASGREITSDDCIPPEVSLATNKVTFRWRGDGVLTVTGDAVFAPATREFRLSARVEGAGEAIHQLSYPAHLDFPVAPGNYTVTAADNQFNTTLKPLADLKDFETMYPGFLFMQMAGFKIGRSALLIYTNDDEAHVKWHRYTRQDDAVRLTLTEDVRVAAGKAWASPYSVVLKTIPEGTYTELAQAYGRWGREQWWAREKLADKTARCPLLKRYFSGGIVRFGVPPYAYGKGCYEGPEASYSRDATGAYHYRDGNPWSKYEPYYDSIVQAMDAFEKCYRTEPGYWFPGWSGHFYDTAFPDYLPVLSCMGDLNAFRKSCTTHGRPVMYHLNIAHWPEINPTPKSHPEYLAINDKGGRYYQTWGGLRHVLTSPDVSLPREMQTVRALVDKKGANGIYLDVIGHAFATDDNPKSQFHDTPNGYQQAKMLAFKTVRSAGDGPLMTEGRNEIELPYMDMGCGANGTPAVDQIPLWQMVYGDCAGNVTYYVGGRSVRNYTWSIGGIQALQWQWPEANGKDIFNHVTTRQQHVVSHVVGKRMLRFERLAGSVRASHWSNAAILWNNGSLGARLAMDTGTLTVLGMVDVSGLAPDGLVMLVADQPDFIADSAAQVRVSGSEVFSCSSNALIVTASEGVLVVHNPGRQMVEATIRLSGALQIARDLSGRFLLSGDPLRVPVRKEGTGSAFSLQLPPGECALLE